MKFSHFLATTFALSLATVAHAETVHLFDCSVPEDGRIVHVKFGATNIEDGEKVSLVEIPGSSEEAGPIVVTPADGDTPTAMSALNDQGGDIRANAKRLKLFGDSDGCVEVDFILYKNSDYKLGYVRVYGSEVETPWYTPISCKHTRKAL